MSLTYDVRLYSIEIRKDRPKPYRVRWLVGANKHSKSYTLKVQAEGRRSELMSAIRRGDQFDEETGLPVSELRAKQGSITWYEHCRAYVDRKRTSAPAKSRKNYADALATTHAGAGEVEGRHARCRPHAACTLRVGVQPEPLGRDPTGRCCPRPGLDRQAFNVGVCSGGPHKRTSRP